MGHDHNHISHKLGDASDLEDKHHPRTRFSVALRGDGGCIHDIFAQENPPGGVGALRHISFLHHCHAFMDVRTEQEKYVRSREKDEHNGARRHALRHPHQPYTGHLLLLHGSRLRHPAHHPPLHPTHSLSTRDYGHRHHQNSTRNSHPGRPAAECGEIGK